MYKACSICNRIHPYNYIHPTKRVYNGGVERELRNTYDWHKKAKEIKERSNYLCSVCKDHNKYTFDNLEVHHINKVKDDQSKLLDNYNLICLCVEHHKLADNGKIDKDYLFKLARIREDGE